ncbi:hypothetical protein RIF29_29351 [Crotalaria pallida]|uniref:Uncharacterized protein n=1 Tax=Crotalaria pallida TaxID=3830 RepID=A0AAN9HTU8_CROPI
MQYRQGAGGSGGGDGRRDGGGVRCEAHRRRHDGWCGVRWCAGGAATAVCSPEGVTAGGRREEGGDEMR